MTAVMICALSLAGLGASHARPAHAPQSAHSNGLPCNAVCKAYMTWSHRVTAMFHPSRPLKMARPTRPQQKFAAHHRGLPRMAHHAPGTRERGLNSFAQLRVQNDATAEAPQATEAPRATETPQAAAAPQVAEAAQAAVTPQVAAAPQAAKTAHAAETPQAAEMPPAAEKAQAAEAPPAEVTASRPIDQIADRFPTAAEFMTARAGIDSPTHEAAESTVVALESRVAAVADTTPADQATGTVDASAHGADMRLVAFLLLALCTLAGLRIWRWFRVRRDADRERISTFDQAIARARPKLRLVEAATELGPGA